MSRRSSNATRDKWIERALKITESRLSMTERELAACVEDACKKLGWRYYHNVPTRRDYPHVTSKGFPDYVLVKSGRLIFAELKAADKDPTPAQKEWLADLEACCAEWYIWRPSDWPERILEVLQR